MTSLSKHILNTLSPLNITLSDEMVKLLIRYSELIVKENAVTNLTGARSVTDFIDKPLFDAMTVLSVFKPVSSLVDIGSGGGLPAFPLSIVHRTMHITMVEPRKRRVVFLRSAADILAVKGDVLHTQDRELGKIYFNAAVSQAVFKPEKWIKRAAKLIMPGGQIYVLSAVPVTDSMLPEKIDIKQQKRFIRPVDRALKFAARLGSI